MNLVENSSGIRNKKIERKIKDVPEIYREIYEKAVIHGNKPAAIKAFCLECACWEKNEIIKCTAVTCPLYKVRPFVKTDKKPKDKFEQQEVKK
ncbi:MAG: hypothetical protein ABSE89_04675 [Sedimentisphaerales bacterium]